MCDLVCVNLWCADNHSFFHSDLLLSQLLSAVKLQLVDVKRLKRLNCRMHAKMNEMVSKEEEEDAKTNSTEHGNVHTARKHAQRGEHTATR